MSDTPKLWRIIAGRNFIDEAGDIQMLQHEFIIAGESLCDVWKANEKLLSGYEYINASLVVIE